MVNIAELRPKALLAAQMFIGTTEVLTELGWGVSGIVFMSPTLDTAIKVHHHPDAYFAEVKAYRLLKQCRLTSLHGLTIPRMHRCDDVRHLVEMDIVSPPFLLDFAGVKFKDPEFSADILGHIHADIDEKFGPNAHIAYAVYHSLRAIGMYYLDLRPTNLNVQGLPGAEAARVDDDA